MVRSVTITITNDTEVAGSAGVSGFLATENLSNINYTGFKVFPGIGILANSFYSTLMSISSNNIETPNGVDLLLNNKAIPNVFFRDRRSSPAVTGTGTTAVQVFSSGTLTPGTYDYYVGGTVTKTGTATTRSYQVIFSFDDISGVNNIYSSCLFSPNTANVPDTGVAMSNFNFTRIISVTSSITALAGTFFAGTLNATAVSNMPFFSIGQFTITENRVFRVHIRQSAGSAGNTVQVNADSHMTIIKVD
jgi:hypothetical protein